MLIGLTGKAGSGKDTTYLRFAAMADRMGLPTPERLAFADKLKISASRLLGLSAADVDDYKASPGGGHLTILGKPMSMREFLQRYGTEAHRDVFGDEFWVDALLPYGFSHEGRIVVVTDVRFHNEADRVRALGGHVVEVIGVEDEISKAAAGHASENGVGQPDFTIDNTVRSGSFAELDRQVRAVISSWYEDAPVSQGETGDPTPISFVH